MKDGDLIVLSIRRKNLLQSLLVSEDVEEWSKVNMHEFFELFDDKSDGIIMMNIRNEFSPEHNSFTLCELSKYDCISSEWKIETSKDNDDLLRTPDSLYQFPFVRSLPKIQISGWKSLVISEFFDNLKNILTKKSTFADTLDESLTTEFMKLVKLSMGEMQK